MKTWYVLFENEAGHKTTLKIEAPTMSTAINKAVLEYREGNRYSYLTAVAHAYEAGLWHSPTLT